MTGNILNIVSTVAGIVFGYLTSWWFTRSSKRDAEAKAARLLNEVSALRGLLSGVAESVTASITPGVEQDLQSARVPDQVASAVATPVKSAASASAVDVLVRASLGALLNEHGEVSVPQLLRAVTRSVPEVSPSAIASSLEALRNAGRVSWPGGDALKAGVVRVNPQ